MGFDANINYSQSTGSNSNDAQVITFATVDPTTSDVNYPIRKEWLNTSSGAQFILVDFTSTGGVKAANWVSIAGGIDGGIVTNISGPVTPDVSDQIFMNTATSTFTDGTTANTLVVEVQATAHTLLVGAGSQVVPTELSPSVGTGIPVISQGILADPVYGTAEVIGGGTGSITFNTYGPVVAGATAVAALTSVTPSATVGIPFVSQGVAANPSFDTAVVAGGGTGIVTTTAFAPVCGGVTATGAFQAADTDIATSGYVFTSNGAAALPTWQPSLSAFTVSVTTYSANDTFTKNANMVYCRVEIVGGGGGAGCGNSTGAGEASAGGGGGSGEWAMGIFAYASVGVTETVTIGAGGTGATVDSNNGVTGGTTSLGTLITAVGGGGGEFGSASTGSGTAAGGGSGTGGTGGNARSIGGNGINSITAISGATYVAVGGGGGASYFAGGGRGAQATSSSGSGVAGSALGSGGGGGISINSSATGNGGNGAAGYMIITQYINA